MKKKIELYFIVLLPILFQISCGFKAPPSPIFLPYDSPVDEEVKLRQKEQLRQIKKEGASHELAPH